MMKKEERKKWSSFRKAVEGRGGKLSDKVALAAVRTGLDVVGPSYSQQVCVMDSVSALW